MATEKWRLRGDYFENCNCAILCPCLVPGGNAMPTDGNCDVALAFHVREGDFNGAPLSGLNFVVVYRSPGLMSEGNWIAAMYIDERADGRQREALGRILSGKAGGPASRWMSVISDFRGIKYTPITYTARGRTRSVSIPQIMEFAVEGITARGRTRAMRVTNSSHPVSSSLALARGTGSTYTDHGMNWDNTGKNGHYSAFSWQGP